MLAVIDAYCIRNGLDTMEVITRWELSRVLQLMHNEASKHRNDLQWAWYPEPPKELLDKIESTFAGKELDWGDLEPNFKA